MNFKSSGELIGRVEETLNSFKASGLLDSGQFYRWIKEVLMKLNIPNDSPTTALLKVNNGKILVPDDLHFIWAIWNCSCNTTPSFNLDLQRTEAYQYYRTDQLYCKTDECEKDCTSKLYEENGELMVTKYYLQTPREQTKYVKSNLIKIKNSVIKCVENNIHQPTQLEASISKDRISFNFQEGYVYLQYYGFQKDEAGLPLIPDIVQIEEAIEAHIIAQFFLQQYYNNTLDAIQRYQLAKSEAEIKFYNASIWRKLPTVNKTLEAIKRNSKRFSRFELQQTKR